MRSTNTLAAAWWIAVLACCEAPALAQELPAAPATPTAPAAPTTPAGPAVPAGPEVEQPAATLYQPRGVQAGPVTITPRLGMTAGHSDNITLAPPAESIPTQRGPITSGYITWTPELTVSLPSGPVDRYELNLRGELTRYFDSSINNSNNVELGLDGLKLVDERTAVAWRLSAQDWHDAVGSTDLSLQAQSPDHFRAAAAGAVLRSDNEAGDLRNEVEATVSRKRYQNHRDITRLGDVDTRSLVGRHLRHLAADASMVTRWLAELRVVSASYPGYPDGLLPLDNTDTRLLTGMQWEPVEGGDAQVSATAKLGLQRKRFSEQRPDYTGVTWDFVLRWQPGAATQFDLASGRAAGDAPGDGADTVALRQESVAWTQLWRHDLRSTLTLVGGRNGYVYGADRGFLPRSDRFSSVEFGLRHDLRRDLQLGFSWSLARRHSSLAVFDYTRHVGSVVLQVAL